MFGCQFKSEQVSVHYIEDDELVIERVVGHITSSALPTQTRLPLNELYAKCEK